MKKLSLLLVGLLLVLTVACGGGKPAESSPPAQDTQPPVETQMLPEVVNEGTLPLLVESEYIGKEGLLVYHELVNMGYAVEAQYTTELGDAIAKANQGLLDTFDLLDPNNVEDRQSVDSYLVHVVEQTGDSVVLIVK